MNMVYDHDIRLGQIINLKTNSMNCSCIMKNKKKCSNKHKFLYHLNTNEIILSCNIQNHKINAFSNIKDDIIATIYRYSYTVESTFIDNIVFTNSSYIVIGSNVNKECNFQHPIIDNKKQPLSLLKNDLYSKITSLNDMITEHKSNIDISNRYQQIMRREIQIATYSRSECQKALLYVTNNSQFVPSNENLLISGDDNMCPICQENITKNTCCQLYECSHTFHRHCIQRWFEKKEHITCPCCRANCNHDNYFVFKQ